MIHSPWITLFATATWCCCESVLFRNGAWQGAWQGSFNLTYHSPIGHLWPPTFGQSKSQVRLDSWLWENRKLKIIKDYRIRRIRSKELNGCLVDFQNSKNPNFRSKVRKKSEFEKYHKILWNIQFYVIEIEIRICHVWNKKRICQTATFCSNTLRVTLCYFKTEAVTWPVTWLHF